MDSADVRGIDGLYVGQLTERELETFNRLVREGRARRVYEGGSGFLGLAKVTLDRDDELT
jgi:hypothetical protein